MSVSDKLSYLNETKQAIKQAIIDKGVNVLDDDTFRSYAEKITSITTGGMDEFVLPPTINVVGNPIINNTTGDISGFSKDNHIFIDKIFKSTSNVEYTVSFTTGATITKTPVFHSEGFFNIMLNDQKELYTWNWRTSEAFVMFSGIKPNTKYIVSVKVNGYEKVCSVLEVDTGFKKESVTSDRSLEISPIDIYFGWYSWDTTSTEAFSGTIHIPECSVKVGGKVVWIGSFQLKDTLVKQKE